MFVANSSLLCSELFYTVFTTLFLFLTYFFHAWIVLDFLEPNFALFLWCVWDFVMFYSDKL